MSFFASGTSIFPATFHVSRNADHKYNVTAPPPSLPTIAAYANPWPWPRYSDAICKQDERRSFYDVMQVSRNANGEQIKAAYRKLVKQLHPDRAASEMKEESANLFCEVQAAYAVLSDARARAAYDAKQSLLNIVSKPGAPYPYTVQRSTGRPSMSSSYHTPRSASASASSSSSSFSSQYTAHAASITKLGRNWETDQCWC
ncbi:hypothetical protein L7F22_059051 [Adiantum nelumboides]|nr:hypothetical protein [Adiantum nelumboides]